MTEVSKCLSIRFFALIVSVCHFVVHSLLLII